MTFSGHFENEPRRLLKLDFRSRNMCDLRVVNKQIFRNKKQTKYLATPNQRLV